MPTKTKKATNVVIVDNERSKNFLVSTTFGAIEPGTPFLTRSDFEVPVFLRENMKGWKIKVDDKWWVYDAVLNMPSEDRDGKNLKKYRKVLPFSSHSAPGQEVLVILDVGRKQGLTDIDIDIFSSGKAVRRGLA
jgi:hypothetical protein